MTRQKYLLNMVCSFLLVLSLFVCKGLAYDIESAIKIATVGPNVYLGSEREGMLAFILLQHKSVEKIPIDRNSSYSYQL